MDDEDLKKLPVLRPDDLHAERVRRRAHAVIGETRLRRAWNRAILPGLLTAASATYLYWALDFTAKLYR